MKIRITSQTKKKQARRETDEATEPEAGATKNDSRPAIKSDFKNGHAIKPKLSNPTVPKSKGFRPDSSHSFRSKVKSALEYAAELAKKAQQAYQNASAGSNKRSSITYNILAWKVKNIIYAQLLPEIGEAEERYYTSIFDGVNKTSKQEIPFVLDSFKDVPPKVAIRDVLLALVDGDKAVLDSCIKDSGVLQIEGLDTYSGQ